MDKGASDKSDRAVVNGAASVSALRASVPSAGVLLQKIAEAEKRVTACESSLSRALSTLSDLQTAHRVIYGVGGVATSPQKFIPTAARQQAIIDLLGIGPENAKPPAALFEEYWETGGEKIKIDTFRTSLWRMVNLYCFKDWEILSDERGYWKEPAQGIEAGTVETERLDPKDESPVTEGDAPETPQVQP